MSLASAGADSRSQPETRLKLRRGEPAARAGGQRGPLRRRRSAGLANRPGGWPAWPGSSLPPQQPHAFVANGWFLVDRGRYEMKRPQTKHTAGDLTGATVAAIPLCRTHPRPPLWREQASSCFSSSLFALLPSVARSVNKSTAGLRGCRMLRSR